MIEVDLGAGVRAVFTRRLPGVSVGPWQGANLGVHVGDDLDRVATNRADLERRLGFPVVYGHQVHGVQVFTVDEVAGPELRTRSDLAPAVRDEERAGHGPGAVPTGTGFDAMVTTRVEVGLAVLVADCVPVLLADAGAGVVGSAHAGRVGLVSGVLDAVVAGMVDAGARAGRIRAALGPAAGPCCYEVPEAMQRDAVAVLPALAGITRAGTPSLDLRAGAAARLADLGVEARRFGGCTIDDEDFYSYRRAPVTGRFAGVVAMVA